MAVARAVGRSCRVMMALALAAALEAAGASAEVPSPKLPVVPPEEAGFSPARLAQIDRLVAEGLEEKCMPGCVVAIGREGKLAMLRAYGNRQVRPATVPMTVDTVFDLASLTKPVATATSVMTLVEQGRLRLDDPVARHLPEFGSHGKEAITVEQLLLHEGGLVADNPLSDYAEGPEKAWQRIAALKPVAAPGSKFLYSDMGFIVLGELVRRVSGEGLDEFARRRIFEPLGMTETTFRPPELLCERAAPTEQRSGRWMQGEVHDPRAYELGGVAGHAGLFSTAADLAVFAQMLLDRGQYGGRRVMAEESVALMTGPHSVSSGTRGLGWDRKSPYSSNRSPQYSAGAFGHGGFTGTSMWIDPERGLFVIFLSNRLHPDGKGHVNPLAARIGTCAVEAIVEGPAGAEPTPAAGTATIGGGLTSGCAPASPPHPGPLPQGEREVIPHPGPLPSGEREIISRPGTQPHVLRTGRETTSVGWTSRSVPTDGFLGMDLEVHPTSNPEVILPQVLTGIDVLARDGFGPLIGRRVGLITNQTGVDRRGVSTAKLLHEAKGVHLVALFSPEHGPQGKLEAQQIADGRDGATGLPVYSLYGATRRPTAEMLAGIDTLVFDIQDVGTRFYTYISTMAAAMEAAAEHKIRFVVLDRPNPINGRDVAGPVLDAGRESFVGCHRLPVRHGMTVGELARMFQAEKRLELDLRVIGMEGWRRGDFFDQTGLPWVNPSPNMRSPTEALLYPGIGLLETTNVSVGRGTDTPFELFGAPWIDGAALARELNAAGLPGIRFAAVTFTPSASTFRGQRCEGVRMTIIDRTALEPVRVGLEIARRLRHDYPKQWKAEAYGALLGNRAVLEGLLAGKPVGELEAAYRPELERFLERRARFLLYPE